MGGNEDMPMNKNCAHSYPAEAAYSQSLCDFPYLRVSILSHADSSPVRMDLCLASTIPVAEIMPQILIMLDEYHTSQSKTPLIRDTSPHSWTLAKIGSAPIIHSQSLAEAKIVEGDTLLVQSYDAPQPPAIFDDAADLLVQFAKNNTKYRNIFQLQNTPYSDQTIHLPSQKYLRYIAIFILSIAMGCGLMFTHIQQHIILTCLGIGFGLGGIMAGIIQNYFYRRYLFAQILYLGAYIFICSGLTLLPAENKAWGLATGLWAVAILASFLVFLSLKISDNPLQSMQASKSKNLFFLHISIHSAIISFSLLVGTGALFSGFFPRYLLGITAIIGGVSIFMVNLAPSLAIMCAKIPLANFPVHNIPQDKINSTEQKYKQENIAGLGPVILPRDMTWGNKSSLIYGYLLGIIFGANIANFGACLIISWIAHANDFRVFLYILLLSGITALRARHFVDTMTALLMNATWIAIIAGADSILISKNTGIQLILCIGYVLLTELILLAKGRARPISLYSLSLAYGIKFIEYGFLALLIPSIGWLADIYSLILHY